MTVPLVELAQNTWRLSLLPFDGLNVYLLGEVVVDSGAAFTRRRLMRALAGRAVKVHVLTHAHPDHQGASHDLCAERGAPLWCGAGDRAAAESGSFASVAPPDSSLALRLASLLGGPGCIVSQTLSDGDRVGEYEVVETPGHTPGHLSLWRPRDGLVILGDVAFNRHPVTLRSGMMEPFRSATHNPGENRRSAHRIAALKPRLVCFGHGSPVDGDAFVRWATALPLE